MYFSEWKEEPDGSYYESKVSLELGFPPIILARAVKNSDGEYEPVIRCAISGRMLDNPVFKKDKNPVYVQHILIHAVYNYIKYHANPMIF